jgi:predicted N-acetyltransferase YhbS
MISYTDSLQGITPCQLQGFLAHWDFVPPEGTLLEILRGSSHFIVARQDSEVVGYIAVLCDHVSCAYISHLEVRAQHRNNGVGKELVQRLLSRIGDVHGIYLGCAPSVEPFYEKLGFTKATGMKRRKQRSSDGAEPAAKER